MNAVETISSGSAILGFELGSTRIKATLIESQGTPLASGSHSWENKLVDGVWNGIAACWADLATDVERKYNLKIERIAAGGFSGMMHGYLVVDREGKLLVPFRTWRNNITGPAAEKLTDLFSFAVPQ